MFDRILNTSMVIVLDSSTAISYRIRNEDLKLSTSKENNVKMESSVT